MESLPLIAGAAIALLLLNNNKTSSSSSSTKKEDKKKIDLVIKPIKLTCLKNQYKDKSGNCKFFWIDGETDELVKQEFESILKTKYKDKSINDICDDIKVKWEILENPNIKDIVKLTIINLWSPDITNNMLPPTEKSPDHIKEIWKKVTNLYFSKVCGV